MPRWRWSFSIVCLAASLLLLAACDRSETTNPVPTKQGAGPSINVTHAWARPGIGAGAVGAAYLTIQNDGDQADRLIKIATPAAEQTELHQSCEQDGVMRMQSIEGIDIPPGQTVELKPGGYHLMLIGMSKSLDPNGTFPLTLTFKHFGNLNVTVALNNSTRNE